MIFNLAIEAKSVAFVNISAKLWIPYRYNKKKEWTSKLISMTLNPKTKNGKLPTQLRCKDKPETWILFLCVFFNYIKILKSNIYSV